LLANFVKFKYKKFKDGTLRSIIKVTLQVGTKHFISEAMVDSGADFCFFDAQFAKILGLELKNGKKEILSGIVNGSQMDYYLHDIDLIIGGIKQSITAGFVENFL
jgi:hypothetical protein